MHTTEDQISSNFSKIQEESFDWDTKLASYRGDINAVQQATIDRWAEEGPLNQHIRFFSDESDDSDLSDSIEDFEGEEQRSLKLRQKIRKKKKAISLEKKHSSPALEPCFKDGPRGARSAKKKYQICSTHRRTASQPQGREDGWCVEEGLVHGYGRGGGCVRSLEGRQYQGSGVGLIFRDEVDSVADSQLGCVGGRGQQLKVLAAKKELHIQKKAGVSYSEMNGGILDKLVELEGSSRKIKATKGAERLCS